VHKAMLYSRKKEKKKLMYSFLFSNYPKLIYTLDRIWSLSLKL
jgi:hypothetical protein